MHAGRPALPLLTSSIFTNGDTPPASAATNTPASTGRDWGRLVLFRQPVMACSTELDAKHAIKRFLRRCAGSPGGGPMKSSRKASVGQRVVVGAGSHDAINRATRSSALPTPTARRMSKGELAPASSDSCWLVRQDMEYGCSRVESLKGWSSMLPGADLQVSSSPSRLSSWTPTRSSWAAAHPPRCVNTTRAAHATISRQRCSAVPGRRFIEQHSV